MTALLSTPTLTCPCGPCASRTAASSGLVLSAGVLFTGWSLALTKKVICMHSMAAAWTQVSLQSIIMDIGPSRDRSEPGSPASMSADFTAAPPAFNPAAFLGAGSSVSSTEHAGQAPQVVTLPMLLRHTRITPPCHAAPCSMLMTFG